MLRVKANIAILASCHESAILAKMSLPQRVLTAAALGVAVKTLCRGRDKFKVIYYIANIKRELHPFSKFIHVITMVCYVINYYFKLNINMSIVQP